MTRPAADCIPPRTAIYWVNKKPKYRVCEATDTTLSRWARTLTYRAEWDAVKPGSTRDARDYFPPIYYTIIDEIKNRNHGKVSQEPQE